MPEKRNDFGRDLCSVYLAGVSLAPMRLFAGLPLSPDAIARLSALRLRYAAPRDGLRWSTPEQWHITLSFFGETDEAGARTLEQRLADVRSFSPAIQVDGLGVFSAKGILYAQVARNSDLEALHTKVQGLATSGSRTPDSLPFRPHITLARSKNRTGLESLRRLGQPALPSFGAPVRWQAAEMLLYQSVLQPGGAAYTTLARFPLQA